MFDTVQTNSGRWLFAMRGDPDASPQTKASEDQLCSLPKSRKAVF
jgi:hypothetical protein